MKKKILTIISFLVFIFLGTMNVDAASYTVSASKNLIKGGSTKLTIKGSDITGRFNISSSNSGVVSISEDRAWIENNSYTITLSALNVGTSTITITPVKVSDSNGNPASVAAKSIKITVSLPREKSNDNNLKSLSIEGYEISPEFNKDVQAYSVIVPENTKKVKVNAQVNESHATVSGTGEIEVTGGVNQLNVIVKSETGIEKTYTITVEVKDNSPINVKVDNNDYTVVKIREYLTKPTTFEETTVKINDFEIPAYINEATKIVLVGLKDINGTISLFIYDEENNTYEKYNEISLSNLSFMPLNVTETLEGYKKQKVTINDLEYEALKFNKDSRYSVIYGQNMNNGEKGLYLYDHETGSMILYNSEYIEYLTEQNNLFIYIIIGFACILFVLFIIIIILVTKKGKKNKKNKKEQKNKKKTTKEKVEDEYIEL